MRNPATSAAQYRLAEAVLHGRVRTKTGMSKKVAREIIEATPAKQRSAFMTHNARRKNFLGFGGGSKTTFSSKLMQEAYDLGYNGKGGARGGAAIFNDWYNRLPESERKTHHGSLKAKLRVQYEKGVKDEHRDHLAGVKKQVRDLKAESRQSKAPPIPKGEKASDQNVEYKGQTIRRTTTGWDVLGEKGWSSLSDAKQYVDLYVASGGGLRTRTANSLKRKLSKARKTAERRVTKAVDALQGKKNPSATLSQGKASAYIVEMGSHRYSAQIVRADGGREEQNFSGPGSFKAAMSWARLRLHEVANAKSRYKVYPLSEAGKRRKSNPEDASVRMYEKFHGMPSEEVREYVEERHRHQWLAGLGPLIDLKVRNVQGNKDVTLNFPDPEAAKLGDVVMLTVEESGTQLYAVGGDQELPLDQLIEQFGMVKNDIRDNMLIGTILMCTYRTRKSFEKQGREEIDFFHAIGKEGSRGVYPVLIYHPRDQSIEIAGGRYYVGKAEPALGNVSAGLIG